MTYEEIVAELRRLRLADFDYNNVEARGRERLCELTDALMATSGGPPKAAIPELFAVMERMPMQIWVRLGRLCIRSKL